MYLMVVIFIDVLLEGLVVAHFSLMCKNENGICTQAELQAVAKFLCNYLQEQGWERMYYKE